MPETSLFGIWSILPPLLAIFLAIRTKQVFISLFAGVWFGYIILDHGRPLRGLVDALEACVAVFADAGNTKVNLFSCMVGALITFTQYSGGMNGFIDWVTRKGFVNSRRKAGLLAWLIGIVIFVESSICVLVAGAVARPLFDKLKISRERLAYICDSTSAPKCILIPLNAWGAFVIGLLVKQGIENPVAVFVSSIPFNFYAIIAMVVVLLVVLFDRDFGPMRRAEHRVRFEGKLLPEGATPLVSTEVTSVQAKAGIPQRAVNMLMPIGIMVLLMPIGLCITGEGNILRGSGATAVFWAVIGALLLAAVSYRLQGILSLNEIMTQFMNGVGGLVPLAALMMLAFAIGDVCKLLHTGPYVASLAKAAVPSGLVPALIFMVSCAIAFATGTSWGTYAIMIPIAMPMVSALGPNPAMMLAAVLGGGVFGDHCSPVSDTTIISSMASACDHIDHVRTQLPYALIAAALALVLYIFSGFILS